MIRYFIEYNELIKDNKLNFEISPYNERIKIIKEQNNKTYLIEPLLVFKDYIENMDSFVKMMESKRKNIKFVFEIKEEEINLFNPLLINSYTLFNGNIYAKNDYSDTITLLDYNSIVSMKVSDINNGNIVIVKYDEKKDSYDIKLTDNVYSKYSISEQRRQLKDENIASDIYFYTKDKELLDKFDKEKVVFKKKNSKEYQLDTFTFIAIDGLKMNVINTFNSNTYNLLYEICSNTIPYYISIRDNVCEIKNRRKDNYKKIYVIMGNIFKMLITGRDIKPIIKYINVYEYNNGKYNIIPIVEYMKEKNILKYVKKP